MTSTNLDEARTAIMAKALEIAPFDGWTVPTLRKAAREAGYAREIQLLAFLHALLTGGAIYGLGPE